MQVGSGKADPQRKESTMDGESRSLRGRRILVVDDSELMTSLVEEALNAWGADVVAVNSGQNAMLLASFGRFDLVLLDLIMPQPDGWAVLQFLKNTQPDLVQRTVVVTADRYDGKAVGVLERDGIAHLSKPFMLEELRKVVCRLASLPNPTAAA